MIRGVLFDLDGTLLDTAPDLVGSLNHLRQLEGLEPLPEPEMAPFASRGARGLIDAGLPEASEEQQAQRVSTFLQHYAAHSWVRSTIYAGVPNLLDDLDARAIPWGVVTNKAERLTLPLIRAVGWERRAICVICGDTTSHSKPHPLPVTTACALIGCAPEHVLLVGDDERDLQAGLAAGTAVGIAEWGYGSQAISAVERDRASSFEGTHALLDFLRTQTASPGQAGG